MPIHIHLSLSFVGQHIYSNISLNISDRKMQFELSYSNMYALLKNTLISNSNREFTVGALAWGQSCCVFTDQWIMHVEMGSTLLSLLCI